MRSEFRPRVTLLYQYFHPDDVVSARLFTELGVGLVARGWDVTALPCDRSCRHEGVRFSQLEDHQGVRIHRVWRPNFRQASNFGRLLNAAWMIGSWSWHAVLSRGRQREFVIVGTDPVLGVLVSIPWRLFRRSDRIVHWCHDLYPEAPIAAGMISERSLPVRVLKKLLAMAYWRCDLIADLGHCMAGLIKTYRTPAHTATLTPWALVEPTQPVKPDPDTRRELFGNARLGLLYSGNFGRAHTAMEFLALARLLRDESIHFCFAGRGNRIDELKKAVTPVDTNITFAGFAPESELEKRLGACDLHLVSLRADWTGTVVPSKFFGALATGHGVLFVGSDDSAIAHWIDHHQVGMVITPTNIETIAGELRRFANDPSELAELNSRCHTTYQTHFSRQAQIDRWDREMRSLF